MIGPFLLSVLVDVLILAVEEYLKHVFVGLKLLLVVPVVLLLEIL